MNKFDTPTLLFVSSILPFFTFGIQKLNLIYSMDLPLPPGKILQRLGGGLRTTLSITKYNTPTLNKDLLTKLVLA